MNNVVNKSLMIMFKRSLQMMQSDEPPSFLRHSKAFKIGQGNPLSTILPQHLKSAIASILKGYSRKILKKNVEELLGANQLECKVKSEYYLRSKLDADLVDLDELPKPIFPYETEQACMAYLAWQIPFAYASIERCLNDVLKRVEGFKPKTLLDFGCGPGTAAVAATTIFSSIKTVDAVDISEQMLILSQRIFSHINALPEHKDVLHYTCKRFLSLCDGAEKSDLVISNMALSDLPDDGVRKITAKELWSRTNDVLVLVERGTPEGARLIGNARSMIIESSNPGDFHIVGPCSHESKCPMVGSWCHFSQRLQITQHQMEVNALSKGFEDQKLSYLIVRRGPRPVMRDGASLVDQSYHWPRLIRRPLKRDGHVILDYCDTDSSFKRVVIPKSQGKEAYYDARKSRWGDLWPHGSKNGARIIPTMKIKPKKRLPIREIGS